MSISLERKLGMTKEDLINIVKIRHENGESITSIASDLGVSNEALRKRLHNAGFHIRKDSDSFNKNITKKQIEELYYDCGLTLNEMCHFLGCKSTITASKILRQYGIDTNTNKRNSLPYRLGLSEDEFKDILYQKYVWEQKSINALSEEYQVSHAIIARYLNKYNIQVRTQLEQIAIQPSATYKGGIRHQNGYIGVAEGKSTKYLHRTIVEQIIGRPLNSEEVVHHIDCNKYNNDIHNLVVLSNSDHSKVHSLLRKGMDKYDVLKEVNTIWMFE